MKAIWMLICLLCYHGYSQDTIVKNDPLGIEAYIWKPVGREKIGQAFPNIKALDYQGNLFEGKRAKKITVYNFWISTCAPCIAEIPMLMDLKRKYESKVDFIAITHSSNEDIKRIVDKFKFDYRQIRLDVEDIDQLRVSSGYPTTVIVCDGKIIYCKHGGPSPDRGNFPILIEKTLKVYSQIIDKYLK